MVNMTMNQVASTTTPTSHCKRVMVDVARLQSHGFARGVDHPRGDGRQDMPSMMRSSPHFQSSRPIQEPRTNTVSYSSSKYHLL